jgi:siroheme synthase
MGVGEAAAITAALLASGKAPGLPVAVVESASLPQRVVRYTTLRALPTLASATIAGPAIILLGPQFTAREAVASPFETEPAQALPRQANA